MKILAENRKAYFDYEVLEKFEAGLALNGREVKSIKNGHISIGGSYVVIDKKNEAFLLGANVPPYQPNNTPSDYDPGRSRKLLLRKKEIKYLLGKAQERGLTLIPHKVYTNDGMIKLEFGVGKGKKKFDKRETIKKRDTEMDIRRELRTRG